MILQWLICAAIAANFVPAADALVMTLDGRVVAEANRSEYAFPSPGTPAVHDGKAEALADRMDKAAFQPPQNAYLDVRGAVVPEARGYKLDRKKFMERFYGYVIEGEPAAMELPRRVVYPRVDSELLISIKEKMIGRYTTYYNPNNKNRSHNISLASEAINNRYVFPGETFSFNETVGERTSQRGYQRAKVIVRGEVSEGIGGGICQISSTLFNAADRAGMEIVQRYTHSRHVPYVPPGRDATVSWYGPDFVFKNPYDRPILIRSFAHHGTATILIYSAEEIDFKPREVPSASKKLPEEVSADRNVNRNAP
ncbi:VanW family protein [Paenibacillaceae bacterium WGS1546]|uniref:VanW family protein n=1 Tax=Cohnella sp. WGS1546 TaxID=3366810 RepID=UPI00372D0FC3